MKKELYQLLDKHQEEIYNLADELLKNPELGYKEFKTKQIIIDFLKKYNIKVEKEYFETGFTVSVGNDDKPHIGLIAELDAITTANHPFADKDTNAAHSCGHFSQCVMMCASIVYIKKLFDQNKLKGKVSLFFTPAEEFIDLNYRDQLIAKGKIKAYGGKQNMLLDNMFDDVSCLIHAHATIQNKDYLFNVKSSLAGFIYKKFIFKGKASHAAFAPFLGHNALNACNLFLNAVGLLRETFKQEDMVRVHGIITKGGTVVNSIPDEVIYEAYVRSFSNESLLGINDKLTNAAKHCAKALETECIVEDIKGYLPFIQDDNLSDVVYQNMLNFVGKENIFTTEKSIASGDIGDLSCFKPTIQFGYTGFSGNIHGCDLLVENKERVFITTTKIILGSLIDLFTNQQLLEKIESEFSASMDLKSYQEYLFGKCV